MLANASSTPLEQRAITLPLERIKVLESRQQIKEIPFSTLVRYGKRPTFNEYDGALRCHVLEVLFQRTSCKQRLIKPLAFNPELTIEIEGFPEFSIVAKTMNFELSEQDALLLAILEHFSRKVTVNLLATGKEPLLYLRFKGQESEIVRLNALEATWLLQA